IVNWALTKMTKITRNQTDDRIPRCGEFTLCPLCRRWLHASTPFLCAIVANAKFEPKAHDAAFDTNGCFCA
ncbi:MAG: hypothetical protein V7695_18415, partial [Sulfitobacter sp.]